MSDTGHLAWTPWTFAPEQKQLLAHGYFDGNFVCTRLKSLRSLVCWSCSQQCASLASLQGEQGRHVSANQFNSTYHVGESALEDVGHVCRVGVDAHGQPKVGYLGHKGSALSASAALEQDVARLRTVRSRAKTTHGLASINHGSTSLIHTMTGSTSYPPPKPAPIG